MTTFKRVDAARPDVINASLRDAENKFTAAEARVTALEDADIDLTADVTGVLPVANGGTGAATLTGLVYGNGTAAMTASVNGYTQVSITTGNVSSSSTTPANITGLSATLVVGAYTFELELTSAPHTINGERYDLDGGTATVSHVEVRLIRQDLAMAGATYMAVQSTLSGDMAWAHGGSQTYVRISGTLTCNAGGTFIPRFGLFSAGGPSVVLRGASMTVTRVS